MEEVSVSIWVWVAVVYAVSAVVWAAGILNMLHPGMARASVILMAILAIVVSPVNLLLGVVTRTIRWAITK